MTDDRKAGLALISGTVGTIITMSLHPSGHDLFAPGQLEPMVRVTIAVHALALACLPVLFLGAWGLSRRVAAPDRLAIAALVVYAFAVLAAMNAAAMSGLVAPALARQVLAAPQDASDALRIMFHYTGHLNQAFASVYAVASSAAILLWSASILRSGALARGVGIYGCILGPLIIVVVLSGHLRLGVHGMGLVVLGQAVWFIIVGALLCRSSGRVEPALPA